MISVTTKYLPVFIMFYLAGCGGDDTAGTSAGERSQMEDALSTQLDALEKAEKVEDQLQQQLEKRDKEMQEKGI